MQKTEELFRELVNIMDILRGPKGCPWDRKQTHKKLLKYLFEEAAEVKTAISNKDWKNLEEELGDVLLQVIFHSQIAKEDGVFSIADVINTLNKKLIRRHPHVFGKAKKLKTPEQVYKQWKEIKMLEKKKLL